MDTLQLITVALLAVTIVVLIVRRSPSASPKPGRKPSPPEAFLVITLDIECTPVRVLRADVYSAPAHQITSINLGKYVMLTAFSETGKDLTQATDRVLETIGSHPLNQWMLDYLPHQDRERAEELAAWGRKG